MNIELYRLMKNFLESVEEVSDLLDKRHGIKENIEKETKELTDEMKFIFKKQEKIKDQIKHILNKDKE